LQDGFELVTYSEYMTGVQTPFPAREPISPPTFDKSKPITFYDAIGWAVKMNGIPEDRKDYFKKFNWLGLSVEEGFVRPSR
jgi:hypothetical protein